MWEQKIFINSVNTHPKQTSNDTDDALKEAECIIDKAKDKPFIITKKSIKHSNCVSSIRSDENLKIVKRVYNVLPRAAQTSNLEEIIHSKYLLKINAQVKFERTGEIDSKIGRPSNYKLEKSSEINNGFINYLKQNFLSLIIDHNRLFRSDQLNTEYFRIIRKIPYYFIENCSTKNLFKESVLSNCVKSFIEATSAFHFSQGNYSQANCIECVVEFSVIYFSKAKCSKLISELMRTENPKLKTHLETQNRVLKIRTGMSSTNLIKFVQLSPTMKSFFEISLKILRSVQDRVQNGGSIQNEFFSLSDESSGIKNMKKIKRIQFHQIKLQTRKPMSINIRDDYELSSRSRLDALIVKTEEILNYNCEF